MRLRILLAVWLQCWMLCGCGGTDAKSPAPVGFPNAGDEQTPPTTGDAAAMKAWLDAGHYLSWPCEPEPHAARGPSMHGMNRSCSNDLVSAFGSGFDERPAGSAAVKEFWDDGELIGRAAYVKTAAHSDQGESWFWYVQIDAMGAAPLANGHASQDPVAKAACVACHAGAGSDADHTTSLVRRSQVAKTWSASWHCGKRPTVPGLTRKL